MVLKIIVGCPLLLAGTLSLFIALFGEFDYSEIGKTDFVLGAIGIICLGFAAMIFFQRD